MLKAFTSRPRVCLVLGAGAGIGTHVASRFAREGFVACLCRRSDQAGLDADVKDIEKAGGAAKGFLMNAITPGSIEEMVKDIEANVGDIEVVAYNLGAQVLQSISVLPWQHQCSSSAVGP